jgi:hypothetical protein
MKKVTTTSDVELKVNLTDKDGVSYNPAGKYIKVRLKVNRHGKEFVATQMTDGTKENCYIDDNGVFVVTIPSNTFDTSGYLWIAVTTVEANEYFKDKTKDVESEFERLEVYYVNQ